MECPQRETHRLKDYDYTQSGGYFVTVCTHERRCILSEIRRGKESERASVELTQLGELVLQILRYTAEKYGVALNSCVIMPNHIHMIVFLKGGNTVSLGRFVGAFKSISSNQWQKLCDSRGVLMGKIWQRDYYDHIIRNETDYLEKLRYIDENPDKWMLDKLYQG